MNKIILDLGNENEIIKVIVRQYRTVKGKKVPVEFNFKLSNNTTGKTSQKAIRSLSNRIAKQIYKYDNSNPKGKNSTKSFKLKKSSLSISINNKWITNNVVNEKKLIWDRNDINKFKEILNIILDDNFIFKGVEYDQEDEKDEKELVINKEVFIEKTPLKVYKVDRFLPRLMKTISKNDKYSLFEFCINILVQKMNPAYTKYPKKNEFMTHNQWTNLIFGVGNTEQMRYLSTVTKSFKEYLVYDRQKFLWDFDKIAQDHPNFFRREESENIKKEKKQETGTAKIFNEFYIALNDEIKASKKNTIQNNTYQIEKITFFKEDIYIATLEIQSDDEPKLLDGLPISVRIGGVYIDAVILDFDKFKNKVYFQTTSKNLLDYTGRQRMVVDASWILEQVKKVLKTFDLENDNFEKTIISKLLKKEYLPKNVGQISKDINVSNLDFSQLEAYNKSISNNISLIWGPPGTGKSYTLAHILGNLFVKKEKTLVCCIANVAVDSLTKKFLNLIEEEKISIRRGSVLRLGNTIDPMLLLKDELFPTTPSINTLRKELENIELKLSLYSKNKSVEEKVILTKLRQSKKEEIDKQLKSLLENANILFSTSSRFYVDQVLNSLDIDNLVIDEASMMSIPHFVALSKNIKKRIIVAGDFRQLGPVVSSSTFLSMKWLHNDVFKFAGVNHQSNNFNQKSLSQLLNQRRSHPLICDMINSSFYKGKLIASSTFNHNDVTSLSPYKDKVITYCNLSKNPDYQVSRTAKGSRYNNHSAEFITKLLQRFYRNKSETTIGIITPYRGQVLNLKNHLKQLNVTEEFKKRVKIGTIHSFQGEEADNIIFDLVDSKHEKIGRLYTHDMGKRLVNVAISRAKSKLIIVGDIDVFLDGIGSNNVDSSVKRVANNIKLRELKRSI